MSRLITQKPPSTCHLLQTGDDDLQVAQRDDLVRMLALLYLVHEFEASLLELKRLELVHGPVHSSIGQEAVSASVAVALGRGDLVASTHRAHGHFLSKAFMYYAPEGYRALVDPITPAMQAAVDRTLAEIMGLKDGWCGGRGGSMHLCDPASGNLGSNAIVGGGIPIATGAAWAQKLQQKDTIVVSLFGDGAINQGCFHEVANMAALWDVPILYLVENNLYAVGTSTTESSHVHDLALRTLGYGFDSLIVDGMDPLSLYVAVRDAAKRIRARPSPFLIEARTYRFFHHGGGLPGSALGYRSKQEEAEWQAKDPVQTFPERLAHLGIVSDEDSARLHAVMKAAVAHAVDLCTAEQDGKRTIPAGHWPAPKTVTQHLRGEGALAGVRTVEREDFQRLRPLTYVEAIAAATLSNMRRDGRVIVLGEEVANLRGGAYGATRGIKEVFPARLINTPISETGFVGMAGGLAAAGLRPVVEVMFPDFALMASDQLFNQIGKLRHMYGGQLRFPLVVRTRVALGFGYGGQHSMDPAGFFALFSGWRILAPSDAFDCIGLFNTAMRLEDPVLFVEHGQLYPVEGQVPAEDTDYCIAYGRARVVRAGRDLTVLTYLAGVEQCRREAEALAGEGLSVEVVDLRTLDYQGMDWATIGESVRKTGSVLIVEQAPRSMTLGARLSDEIQARFFDYLDGPIVRMAGLDVPPPVSRRLEEAVLPLDPEIRTQMRLGASHRQ
jgi:2-oxoisovalerate dehydrogenase E1 component